MLLLFCVAGSCIQNVDPELPLFDLGTVVAATDNFSSENKIGEGGFGPVYKVMSHLVAVSMISLSLSIVPINIHAYVCAHAFLY